MQMPPNNPSGLSDPSASDFPYAPSSTAGATNDPASGDTSRGTDQLKEAGERAKHAASQAAERAKERATETGERAKAGAADEIERTASALEAAADELEDAPMQRELFREAASGLMDMSDAVRGRSIGEIAENLSNFGRRNPFSFLGGAAMAGFAVARFARASAPSGEGRSEYGGSEYGRSEYGRSAYAGTYGNPEFASAGTATSSAPEIRRPIDE